MCESDSEAGWGSISQSAKRQLRAPLGAWQSRRAPPSHQFSLHCVTVIGIKTYYIHPTAKAPEFARRSHHRLRLCAQWRTVARRLGAAPCGLNHPAGPLQRHAGTDAADVGKYLPVSAQNFFWKSAPGSIDPSDAAQVVVRTGEITTQGTEPKWSDRLARSIVETPVKPATPNLRSAVPAHSATVAKARETELRAQRAKDLEYPNIQAFLAMIAVAEGGDYHALRLQEVIHR